MAEIEVNASQWRLVEVGRVILFTHGTHIGRLAVIVEIIDHKRVSWSTSIRSHMIFMLTFWCRSSLTDLQKKITRLYQDMLAH